MRSIIAAILLCFICTTTCALTNAQIKQKIIERSIAEYLNSYLICPCPYSKDKYGNPCGENNAWTVSKHKSVYCYPADVPASAVQQYRP